MEQETVILIAWALLSAPGLIWVGWRVVARRTQRTERREMLRRNKVARDWRKGRA